MVDKNGGQFSNDPYYDSHSTQEVHKAMDSGYDFYGGSTEALEQQAYNPDTKVQIDYNKLEEEKIPENI
jgi:hypothetical protein